MSCDYQDATDTKMPPIPCDTTAPRYYYNVAMGEGHAEELQRRGIRFVDREWARASQQLTAAHTDSRQTEYE